MRIRHLVLSILVSGSLASFPLSAAVWTVPGAVNAGGLNNTLFVSDLALTNPGTAAVQATIAFLPSSVAAKSVTLDPGETVVYRNVVNTLFGLSGAGALSISASEPLLLRARTYNTASGGTYGVALPVYDADRLLLPGETGNSLWISQDASGNSGYRTNVAVVFPDASGGDATVTVYDSDGNERGRQNYSLGAAGLQQFSVGSFAGAMPVARAQIAVTRGHAAGYAVVVDNVTGDSSLFAFEDLPAGIQDVLVNGVARASGRNGAFFRTDGRFYNPTDTDAAVSVAFHASGNANPAPASASFTLPAGKIRDVVDVLDSLLGIPVGSAGALRFRSSWPVAILCRTSNVDPSGARPGTFGSQQRPVPLLSFLSSADAGAVVTGIRENPSYRTNVGFAAGADGAAWALTLKTAGGAEVATASGTLGPFGWSQPGMQDLFPTTTIPADATLQVKVTSGSLDVFDSSIDNASGDPVVSPIAQLPAAIPASATIGPAGGSIRSSDGRLTLRVPAGAVTQAAVFSLQATTSGAPQANGPGYLVLPGGVAFAKPALLTMSYGRAETDGSSAEALTLASPSSGGWTVLGGGSVDPSRRRLTVPLPATAPAARAPVAQARSLADGFQVDVVRSWEFYPLGTFAILTGGSRSISVHSVGESSSTGLFGSGPILSNSPLEVQATWYVNGAPNGTGDDGRIVPESAGGTLSVKYRAPECPPQENPVRIDAIIINNPGTFRLPYRPSGLLKFRVLARKWRLTFNLTASISCERGLLYSDDAAWGDPDPSVEFTLDDSFRGTAQGTFPSASYAPTACPCPGGSASIVGTPSPGALTVNLLPKWDVESDLMQVGGSATWPNQSRMYHCTSFSTDLPIVIVGLALNVSASLEAASWRTYYPDSFGGRTVTLRSRVDPVCP